MIDKRLNLINESISLNMAIIQNSMKALKDCTNDPLMADYFKAAIERAKADIKFNQMMKQKWNLK